MQRVFARMVRGRPSEDHGLESIEDSWETVKTMYEDVPVKLKQFLDHIKDTLLCKFVLGFTKSKSQPTTAPSDSTT
ncbi:hypothetical protein P3T76_010732 [Phytophthora citrophthora]|uniref:Uncharacterized protein n=1 Tax=Phytophthora citrophthora TaxID=4793 RepID=A0AAD9GBX5_9STRA|nr:hypothetical protein P3T76_010732 [Phytophthora citrophthora]